MVDYNAQEKTKFINKSAVGYIAQTMLITSLKCKYGKNISFSLLMLFTLVLIQFCAMLPMGINAETDNHSDLYGAVFSNESTIAISSSNIKHTEKESANFSSLNMKNHDTMEIDGCCFFNSATDKLNQTLCVDCEEPSVIFYLLPQLIALFSLLYALVWYFSPGRLLLNCHYWLVFKHPFILSTFPPTYLKKSSFLE